MRALLRVNAIVAALLGAAVPTAMAQTVCPESVIRIVVPFPPGGPTDVSARVLSEKLRDRLGQNVIVESRAGAAGATGTGYVAQQPGNGCTMLLAYDTHAVNPSLLKLPFDTATAFKPVMLIGTIPNMIAAHPSQPWKTFQEMAADAKKERGALAYATGGSGTVAHMTMKLIEQLYGFELRQVPYKGGAPAAADLIAGHVPMMIGSVTALGAFVRDGKARAVQTGAARHALLPDTPTVAELGQPGFQAAAWMRNPGCRPRRRMRPSRGSTPSWKAVLQDAWVKERMAAIGVQLAQLVARRAWRSHQIGNDALERGRAAP